MLWSGWFFSTVVVMCALGKIVLPSGHGDDANNKEDIREIGDELCNW